VFQLLQEITKKSNLTKKIDLFNNIYNDLKHIFQNIHLLISKLNKRHVRVRYKNVD